MFNMKPEAFVGIGSDREWMWMEQKLYQELEDRRTVAAAGWKGVAAAMAAGALSPTILLPAGAGARATTVGRAAISAATWTAIGIGAQEAVLQKNQEFRTVGETAIGVGTGAILGGMLGGAVRWLDPLDMARIADGMDGNIAGVSISSRLQGIPEPEIVGEEAAKAWATPLDFKDLRFDKTLSEGALFDQVRTAIYEMGGTVPPHME